MKNKYKMTIEDNIFWAKRNLIDTIYKNAKLEGINVTFPQTEAIVNGGIINNVASGDIEKVLGMKQAWEFIIETINEPLTYAYICEIHKLCAVDVPVRLRGKLRNVPVSIGGTSWKPQFPIESQIKEELDELLAVGTATDKALNAMFWGMRRQMFLDGNKRASMLVANKILIQNGCGIVAIQEKDLSEFGRLLINYYETNDVSEVKEFVYQNELSGFDSEEVVQEENNKESFDEDITVEFEKMILYVTRTEKDFAKVDYYINDKETGCMIDCGSWIDEYNFTADLKEAVKSIIKDKDITEQILSVNDGDRFEEITGTLPVRKSGGQSM